MTDYRGNVPQVGQVLGGRYRVDGFLGAGGMSVVFAATDLRRRRPVALKVSAWPEADGRDDCEEGVQRQRLLREARVCAAVDCEHVVHVHDAGTADGAAFFVMELLVGCDLSDLIDYDGPLPIGQAVALMMQATAALDSTHRAGIVHGDLKPANLFLSVDELERARLKLLDFGVARLSDPAMARDPVGGSCEDTLSGTLPYMSPEQLRGAPLDARADVWSLGVVLYELLTGERPFEHVYKVRLMQRVLSADPVAPSTLRPGVPPRLDQVVMRCLRKDRTERYQSMAELAAALAPFVGDEPELPRPVVMGAWVHGEASSREPTMVSSRPPPLRSNRPSPPSD